MLFTFMKSCFNWLPLPLFLLVSTVFTIFAVTILIEVIKLIATILEWIVKLCGGLIGKVVDFFV